MNKYQSVSSVKIITSFILLFGISMSHNALPPAFSQSAVSEKCITKVGSPTDPSPGPLGCSDNPSSGGAGGPCQSAPEVNYTADEYVRALEDKWGIHTVGLSLEQLQMLWEEFHEIDCTGILQDIAGTEIERWDNNYSQQFSCPGDTLGVDVRLGNFTNEYLKPHIVHELTHVWQFCSDRGEQNLLDVGEAYDGEGGLTKYSRNECSTFSVAGNRLHHEDQADTIALYLNPESGELTCGDGAPNPFIENGFPLHREAGAKGTGQ